MGGHKLPKGVMSGELENTGEREPRGRRNNGRTTWQQTVDYLVSWGTGAPPHLTLRFGTAQYAKGDVDLWPRG